MHSPRRSLALRALFAILIGILCLHEFHYANSSAPKKKSQTTAAQTKPSAVGPNSSGQNKVSGDDSNEKTDLSQFTFATLWGREKNPTLTAFSKWTARYTNAAPAERVELLPEGLAIARERHAAYKELIRAHPKLALAETVPALVRNQLPQSILALLEQRVTGMGDLAVLGRTDAPENESVSRRAIIDGREFHAFVYGDRASQKTSSNISLHGVALDNDLALSDSPLRVFEPGESVPADKPLAADSCPISRQPTAPTRDGPRPNAVAAESGSHIYWMCHGKHVAAAAGEIRAQEAALAFQSYDTTGVRSALIMLVDFPDLPGASAPNTTVDATMAAVDSFLAQCSYGDLHLSSHTTTPLLRMPRTGRAYSDLSNSSGDSLLLNDARNAARNAGFNPDAFDFDLVVFADIGFGWAGQGYVGAKGAWIQGPFAGATVGHELGHNLGVWHANSWNSIESPISPNGSHEEYGNPFDVMGRSSVGFPNNQYSANFKHLLGWLPDPYVTVVNGSGTFRLYAHDQISRLIGRTYALNIPVGIIAGNEIEDYWIDFRQLFTNLYPATADGAIIQWGNDSGTQFASRLLDMNFATSTKSDSPLSVGHTFNDPDSGLQITPLAKGGSGADTYLDIQINLTTPPIVDLAEALDNTNFVWTTSAAPWTGQRTVTHDASDAAASAPIRDNSETFIETTVDGPGAIFFWWKVSSEENFDFLKFTVDNGDLASISGQVDWQKRGYELSTGSHTMRWTYKKDAGSSAGADRAWLDEVTFVNGNHPPFINSQSLAVTAGLGDVAELHVDAIGSDPLTYQWQKMSDTGDPVTIPAATNTTLTITGVSDSDAGLYNCVIQNPFGSITTSNIILSVVRIVSLAEAVDDAFGAWSTFGAVAWTGQQVVTQDGNDAAQSGPVSDGKDTSLEAIFTGPGSLSFWWKVSSEPDYDVLSFYMDGDLIEYQSGEFDWTQKSLIIPNGVHRFRWTYSKDVDTSEGQDAGWVDQVQFTPIANAAPQFTTWPSPQSVSLGGSALFTAQYTAPAPVTFLWLKDGVPLVERPGLLGINTDTLLVTNVQSADAGSYSLRISNNSGSITSSGAALSIVPMSLADALDQPTRAFLTGGSALWAPQTTVTHDLSDAAKPGLISDDQFTWIETRVDGPADVSFWWKVSSEPDYDILSFEIDTIPTLNISGQVDWRHESLSLDPGPHVLRWKYRKDATTSRDDDTGWLDQLDIVSTAVIQPQISDLFIDSNGVNAIVQPLPASGSVVLETSADLLSWSPVSTNQITGSSLAIRRAAKKSIEFLRVKIQ